MSGNATLYDGSMDYVETSGSCRVDTNFQPNQDTRIRTKILVKSVTNGECVYFGAGQSYQDRSFECYLWTSSGLQPRIQFNYDGQYTFSREYIHVGDIIEMDFNKNIVKYKINDGEEQTITFTYTNFTCPNTLCIMANNRPEGHYYGKYQFYYCEVYDNGNLIYNYVPKENLDTGAITLYDEVSGTFAEIQGGGTLEPGTKEIKVKKSIVNASKDITQLDYDLAECEEGRFSRYVRVNYLSNYSGNISNASLIATDIP